MGKLSVSTNCRVRRSRDDFGAGIASSPEEMLRLERSHAEAFAAESVVPGVEVHNDRDVTWVVHPGAAWRNTAIMIRFTPAAASRRLDTLLSRYKRHGRACSIWVSPSSQPSNLTALLRERRLRCQKHFPGMSRILNGPADSASRRRDIEIRRVLDMAAFHRVPHPHIGPVTTPQRHRELERLSTLVAQPSARTRAFVAWVDGQPAGALELFNGTEGAAVLGLRVPPQYRGRGIGGLLIERACDEAARAGAQRVVLLASSDGQRLYMRHGFQEVGRLAYWYRSFQRGS